MESDVKLYGEIMKICKIKSEDKQQELWSVLKRYSIRTLCDSSSFDIGFEKFMAAKQCEGCSKATLQNYNQTIKKFKAFYGNELPNLEEITKDDVRKFITYLESKGNIKKTSIAQYLGVLKNWFMWLEYENYIFKNPAKTICYKVPKEPRHTLTNEEVEDIQKACRSIKEKALFNFLCSTGCRVSEVAGLKLADVNFEKNQATVFGKGSKTRIVFFDNETKKLLKQNLKSNKSGYLFCSEKNNHRPIQRYAIEACLRRLGERAYLERPLFPHLCRHRAASHWLEEGMDLISIQKLLGHDNLSTTQIYAEHSLASVRKQYDSIMEH